MRFLLLLAICLVATSLRAEPAAVRMWTDAQQRRVEASLENADGDKVTLRLRDGRQVSVPMASLSEADRAWVAAQKTGSPAEAVASNPPAEKDWPRTVGLKDTPVVKVIREDTAKKEFVYESEHYEFVCDSMLGANLVREFSRVFEATWLANCLLPLDFKPSPENGRKKFRARIFTRTDDYHTAGGPEGSAGVYSSAEQSLKLPLASLGVKMFGTRVTVNYSAEDYSTLVHEITHQMMNHWLSRLPVWYIEGSAEYLEMAKYDHGRLSFLQQDKRLRERVAMAGDARFQMVSLKKLMNIGSREWLGALSSNYAAERNYASAAALTYYFYHLDGDGDGAHLREYLRAVEKQGPGGNGDALVKQYLLRDRDYDALQKDVQKALRRLGIIAEFSD